MMCLCTFSRLSNKSWYFSIFINLLIWARTEIIIDASVRAIFNIEPESCCLYQVCRPLLRLEFGSNWNFLQVEGLNVSTSWASGLVEKIDEGVMNGKAERKLKSNFFIQWISWWSFFLRQTRLLLIRMLARFFFLPRNCLQYTTRKKPLKYR